MTFSVNSNEFDLKGYDMKKSFTTKYVIAVIAFCAGMLGLLCFAIVEGFRIGYTHYKDDDSDETTLRMFRRACKSQNDVN